jgi:hypothetical protein
MVVYHYARIDRLSRKKPVEPLMPMSRLDGIFFEGTMGRKATFALPEPLPHSWINNQDFPTAWDALKKYMGKMLMEITLEPSDNVMVLDQALTYDDDETIPAPSDREAWARIEKEHYEKEERYWNSRVPFEQYLADPSRFSLPEIIILNPIPRERARISNQQPLIEEVIRGASESGNIHDARKLLGQLKLGIPELQPWIAPCEETVRQGRMLREQQRSHREAF